MEKNRLRVIMPVIGVVFLIIIDQATKYLAQNALKGKESYVIIPGVFELQYLEDLHLGCCRGRESFLSLPQLSCFF